MVKVNPKQVFSGTQQKFATTQKRLVEKGGLFVAMLFMGIALFSMAVNFFIVLTLWQTAPQLQVISQVVFQDAMGSKQLMLAEPFNSDMTDPQKLNEMFVRYYLINRLSTFPDPIEINQRWGTNGIIYRLSTAAVYAAFIGGTNLDQRLQAIERTVSTTNVSISKISRLDYTWTVDVDLFQYDPMTNQVFQQTVTAVVEIRNDPARVFFNYDLINPHGFIVVNYRQTQKKI